MRLSLKKFLVENNISIEDASKMTGVSESVIRRVCRGTIPVSSKTKVAFKETYDLDIIEINHDVLINNETKKEEKEMKEQIKMLKNEHKENVKELKTAYKNEANELKRQIKLLEKQAEIKELKSGLAQVLSSDDDFFTRPDVLKFVKKLISLLDGKEDDEEEPLELMHEKSVVKETESVINKDEKKVEKPASVIVLDSDCDELDDSKVYDPVNYTGDDDEFFSDVEDKTKALINKDAFASADDELDDDFDYGEDEDDEYESEEFLNDNDILKTFEEWIVWTN